MPLTAWPPPTAPAWPPTGYNALEFSDLDSARAFAVDSGWQVRQLTAAEQRAYFRDARCEDGHAVTGVLLDAPGGPFPFARCGGPTASRVFMVPWGPSYAWGVS